MIKERFEAWFERKEYQRDILPDVLKGFGTILVVLGHCIQIDYINMGSDAYFDDKLYQFIYSFHMPLFMLISGYYAWNSVHRAVSPQEKRKMIKKKCAYLIIPNIAWKFIWIALAFVMGTYIYLGPVPLLIDFVTGMLTTFWFLWAVLYSFLLVCLMHYGFKDSVWIYVLIFIAMFFTPDGLGLGACKYMLPYYLIGFYANKNKDSFLKSGLVVKAGRKGKEIAVLISGCLFLALVSYFNADSFIYLTGYKLIGKDYKIQLQIDIYRFLVGFCGIIFWSLLWSVLLNLCRKWKHAIRALAYIGSKGMGIYIVSGLSMQCVVRPFIDDGRPHYGINLMETVLVLLLSLIIIEVLGRIKGVHMIVGQ